MTRFSTSLASFVSLALVCAYSGSAFAQDPVVGGKPPTTADAPPGKEVKPAEEEGNHPAPNSIYAEGLGAGLAYSVNYERRVIDDLGVRVGFSYLSFSSSASAGGSTASSSSTFLTFPITASYLGVRSGKHALELGAGATLAYASAAASGFGSNASGSGITPYGVAMVGYRLHPVDHAGFQFRIGVMALAGEGLSFSKGATGVGVLPWGYISLGASF